MRIAVSAVYESPMLPPPPPVLLILGTDAAGKDYVAEFLIGRWRAAGHRVEKRTGKPAAFIETDLVDPRYFSAANVKNRLESYFQMVKQKRTAGTAGSSPGFIPIATAH